MTKMFSKYDKNDKFINPGKSTTHKKEILKTHHITLFKARGKKKILIALEEKPQLTYQGTKTRMTAGFLLETMYMS